MGADFDIESVRIDHRGRFWFSDEFGPFLLKTDANGIVLGPEIAIPGVFAPRNPFRGETPPNLRSSGGLEGLGISPDGKTLYPLLEGVVTGDPPNTLRLYTFDVDAEAFAPGFLLYPLTGGAAIGDITAIDERRFLVIERDNGQGAAARFKRIFAIDLGEFDDIDGRRVLRKQPVVDLLDIRDPSDLDGDGLATFRFPFVTIEAVAIVDPLHIIVVNDNNYPFSTGRRAGVPDDNEFILLRLDRPLMDVPEPAIGLALVGLGALGLGIRRSL
ncbi:MAG: esterase-like activity of phytase family protein [Acetobacteraceae bacterium]|nr:esterase-like activity of phytase family protein [Acetobacteraceae bacterium]